MAQVRSVLTRSILWPIIQKPCINGLVLRQQRQSKNLFEVFVYNRCLTFLYKIDIQGFSNVLAKIGFSNVLAKIKLPSLRVELKTLSLV